MDVLLEASEAIQHDVFFSAAHLFNLECDLLFLDTTTTYFEIEGEDADDGLRRRGYNKDGRHGSAQVVIGWAVTRGGIPVRCWVWPGKRSDSTLVEEVKRARMKRGEIVAEVERRLAALAQTDGAPHRKAACELRAHPTFGRYVRQTKTGTLVLNREKIRDEERLDGKFLIRVSEDGLSAQDAVAGYKQLWQVERVFRDLKHVVDIRPVHHRLEDRIRAHVLLCWLAMLLIRLAENGTGQTWHQLQRQLRRLEVGIHRTRSGEVWQTNRAPQELEELFDSLDLKLPPRYLAIPAVGRPAA